MTASSHPDLGRVGVWGLEFRSMPDESADLAAELEELGFGTLWVPGAVGGPVFDDVARLLKATRHLAVATGVVNIWMHDPNDVARAQLELRSEYPGRFLLGLGTSHAAFVEPAGHRYSRPWSAMCAFLDALDAAGADVCRDERVLAALGPRMLELARERTAGTHPFLVTPEHTAMARAALGPDKLVAPEIKAVLVSDPEQARAIARTQTSICVAQPNYVNNLRRMGFMDEDFLDGGSDRLVDAVVAWGDESDVAARVTAHLDAGADHVAVQVLTSEPGKAPREEWRRIAAAVAG